MRQSREFEICKDISLYLRMQYPTILYHWDYAGLFHTKVQASMMKSIQLHRGFPDLFIAEARHDYFGFFLEIKAEGTKLFKKNFEAATPHISEQLEFMDILRIKGYRCDFGIGWDDCHKKLDEYLS